MYDRASARALTKARSLLCRPRAAFWSGAVVTFGLVLLCALRLDVPVISDEVIHLAYGEYLLGNDWSYFIAAAGSMYFKWFYGVVMTPILWLFRDPHAAYRAMMVVNGLLQAGTMPVCYFICRRYLRVESAWLASLIGMCAALVPSVFLYAFYARGDVFLCVLPWYVLVFLLEGMRAGQEHRRGRKALCSALAALAASAAFMAHTRGIVVLAALVITAVLMRVFVKKSAVNWVALLLTAAAALVLDYVLSHYFREILYQIGGTKANTLDDTPLGRYFDIFAPGALENLLVLLLAWLYTLFSTSYGLVAVGLLACAVVTAAVFSRRDDADAGEKLTALFGLLAFLGYIAVGLLFFKGTYASLRDGDLTRRVDRLVYDRYSYCALSLVVFMAVYALAVRPQWFTPGRRRALIVLTATALALFFGTAYAIVLKYPGYLYNTISLNAFEPSDDPWGILWGGYYTPAMLIGSCALGAAGFIAALAWPAGRSRRMAAALLAVFLAAELSLALVNYRKVRLRTDDAVAEATAPVIERIEELDVGGEYPYIYKCGVGNVRIQYYQFQMPRARWFGGAQWYTLGEDHLVVGTPEDVVSGFEGWDGLYYFADTDYAAAENDAVYVYGEGLMQTLTQKGYTLYPMEGAAEQ